MRTVGAAGKVQPAGCLAQEPRHAANTCQTMQGNIQHPPLPQQSTVPFQTLKHTHVLWRHEDGTHEGHHSSTDVEDVPAEVSANNPFRLITLSVSCNVFRGRITGLLEEEEEMGEEEEEEEEGGGGGGRCHVDGQELQQQRETRRQQQEAEEEDGEQGIRISFESMSNVLHLHREMPSPSCREGELWSFSFLWVVERGEDRAMYPKTPPPTKI
ncbi:hypothetical protein EYF80_009394 [Liparis tanakae]|uniref:Uncharacterized protein n=1 Tax=Liparis tanakae TaxID=230148 RepID=A0A4Z2IQU8_9TELE|nr:hypothetical protein EYF80_009394 [Liparis tanakae]